MQPLLALCGNNWKAEQMLRNTLKATKKEDQELAAEDDDDDAPIISPPIISPPIISPPIIELASDKSKKQKKDLNSTPIRPEIEKRSKAAPVSPLRFETAPAPVPTRVGPALKAASFLGTPLSEAASLPEAMPEGNPQPEAVKEPVDVDFIAVNPSVSHLLEVFRDEFPDIKSARPLLEAMKAAGVSDEDGAPDDGVISLLNALESADPNDDDLDSDNDNEQWGHKQFNAGFTYSGIKSWDQVGTVATACRLIAAALRTCKVARHMCFVRDREAKDYLSDVYLEKLVDTISECWNKAHPTESSADGSTPQTELTEDELRASWSLLTKDEIKAWLEKQNIKPKTKPKTKIEFVTALFECPEDDRPTEDDVRAIIKERKGRKSRG
ncbi:hypothetical protein FA95DRAFT_1684881 [Auriscalpium vulgare]|uniref:Uncharacterized protein n=1 Tax=Auriscalpium vulgare TaxID=40419 RepID=A0ACB8R0X7_9AGAM|nr:hypothetical protein FA95DRAFT_1684881 [Auriscalpium vulgare]